MFNFVKIEDVFSHKLSLTYLWPLLCSRKQVVSNLLGEQKYSTKQLELKEGLVNILFDSQATHSVKSFKEASQNRFALSGRA